MKIDPTSTECYCCRENLNGTGAATGECPECSRIYNFNQRRFAVKNPALYTSSVPLQGGEQSTVLNLAEQMFDEEIIAVFGVWAVTTGGIECLSNGYSIVNHRLNKEDWVSHLGLKNWVNIGDFSMAFNRAIELSEMLEANPKK